MSVTTDTTATAGAATSTREVLRDAGLGRADGVNYLVRRIDLDAPWMWLAAGWRDIVAAPAASMAYGAAFSLISGALLWGLFQVDAQALVLVLVGGFLILGPMLAVGLYEISRRREAGQSISFADVAFVKTASPGQLAFLGFLLLFLYVVWIRVAFLLFAIFFGATSLPPVENFLPELLFTPHGLGMLVVGTAVGAILAFLAYIAAAVSIPMLTTERLDAMTAIRISATAVFANLRPMLLWAVLIVAAMACGIATGFVGLVIAFPLIGHATWHAYQDLIERVDGPS